MVGQGEQQGFLIQVQILALDIFTINIFNYCLLISSFSCHLDPPHEQYPALLLTHC